MGKILKTKVMFIFILLINLSIILSFFYDKQGFHSDEQWSYAHANSIDGAYLDKEIDSFYQINDNIRERLFNQTIDSKVFYNYLTVQPQDKFSYKNIYKNLEVVEHPPLYFILLHTICSIFPNSFSKWYAGSINIIAFILIYIMLFKLSNLLLKNDKLALITTAFWGFSLIGIETVVFLRMYILQTLLSLCFVYEIIKIIEENKASNKQLGLIGLYSFLAMYNQYNSIFFSFFATLVSGFILYKRKNNELLLKFIGAMLLSLVVFFVIYPQAYDVLFHSLRAKQVISNIKPQSFSSDIDIMNIFFHLEMKISIIFKIIFNNFLALKYINYKIVASGIIVGLFLGFYFKIKIGDSTKWLISVLLLYIMYLQQMPYMHLFHNRYYMSIMPFIAILMVKGMAELLFQMHISNKNTVAILTLLVAINSFNLRFIQKSPYAFSYGPSEYQIKEKIKNKEVFIDNGDHFIWLHSMVYYLMSAKTIYITENICDEKPISAIKQTKNPIIFTYFLYIPKKQVPKKMNCLNDLGLEYKTTVCPSQHCYDVWE